MLAQTAPLNRVLTPHHFHDLGKLLFAFLMLWAYLSFSQFLIIWSANLPEEIPHYLTRWDDGWQYVSVVHHRRCTSSLPYALLLSRDLKRNMAPAARHRDLDPVRARWSTTTGTSRRSSTSDGFSFSLLDIALPIAIGGIFLTLFVSQLARPLAAAGERSGSGEGAAHHVH